jgi:alpha-D-xyloside xylohydrolase
MQLLPLPLLLLPLLSPSLTAATPVVPATGAAAGMKVTLTPWCDNSMRVRVAPAELPAAAEPAAAALKATLAKKNMTDLDGALWDKHCTPGAAKEAAAGSVTKQGNLAVRVSADGALSFTRVDTGAVLLSAEPSFALNAAGAPDDVDDAAWKTMENKVAASCSGGEFDGGLGSAKSAAECLSMVEAKRAGGARIDYGVWRGDSNKGCFVCDLSDRGSPATWKFSTVQGAACFVGPPVPPPGLGYLQSNLTVTAGDKDEVIYGLGQGNWTGEGGCPAPGLAGSRIVPLERNGQRVNLQQRKFHVSIPMITSTAGFALLWNMPGYGEVSIGEHGVGGSAWSAKAALYIGKETPLLRHLYRKCIILPRQARDKHRDNSKKSGASLDFWVSALPADVKAPGSEVIYKQYADATGHAPPLREDAMIFWQSRNRYKSSEIALSIADRYSQLDGIDVGALLIRHAE